MEFLISSPSIKEVLLLLSLKERGLACYEIRVSCSFPSDYGFSPLSRQILMVSIIISHHLVYIDVYVIVGYWFRPISVFLSESDWSRLPKFFPCYSIARSHTISSLRESEVFEDRYLAKSRNYNNHCSFSLVIHRHIHLSPYMNHQSTRLLIRRIFFIHFR